ncbi:MAG: glycoside hydrolase family 2 TIM barrel-domain containing protein [Bacilli bacterium]
MKMYQSLNLNWQFCADFTDAYLNDWPTSSKIVHLPHTVEILPLNYFDEHAYQKVVAYRKEFSVEDFQINSVFLLHFAGVMVQFDVYLNGQHFGHFAQPYLPVEIDVTKAITKDNNRLIVIVDGREDNLIPPFGGAVDFLTFAGIYRDIILITKPQAYIKAVHVSGADNGNVEVDADLVSHIDCAVELTYRLFDQDHQLVHEGHQASFAFPNRYLWSIQKPYLYTLEVELKTDDFIDVVSTKFGFRSVKFTAQGFYLNNEKIKIIGLNRHQSFPYIGYAAGDDLQKQDALILKQNLGLNAVRCSHYPPSQSFLDACDEVGLLVIDEVPGWQHISRDHHWRERHLANVRAMIERDYNHPSVVLYSIRINESDDDHALYQAANEIAHQLDKTRPTTGVRNFANSELLEDVYAYNDFIHDGVMPGLTKPQKVLPKNHRDAPYIVTENNGHMFPTKSFDDPLHRLEHVKRHLTVLNALKADNHIIGGFSWCFVDYQTHSDFGSGDHICYHGVYDIFRNPKPAGFVYAAELTTRPILEVLSAMDIGDYPANALGETYVLTNCDYVELYKNDDLVGRFYPNHKRYPALKHPPVVITNYVSQSLLQDPRFSTRDAKKIHSILGYASMYGPNRLKLAHRLQVLRLMMRYKLKNTDIFALWGKYVSGWGSGKVIYKFKGFQNQQLIIEKQLGPKNIITLKAAVLDILDSAEKREYITIHICLVDDYGNPAIYSSSPLSFAVSNGLQIAGPSSASLHAGQYTLYVRIINPQISDYQIDILSPQYGEINLKGKI